MSSRARRRVSQKREINEQIFIESQVNLSHVRYVQDPYYNKQRKQFETVVYVDVSSDYESSVKNAVTKCLNKAGFATGKDKNVLATCLVKVDEGYQKTDSGTFYFPSAVITLSGRKAGEVSSCAVNVGKQGAINEDVAKRRAYGNSMA